MNSTSPVPSTTSAAEACHTGSCLCGGVRFAIHGELPPIQVCHCSQCRKAQGGPLATNLPVQTDALTWLAGQETLHEYESSPGKMRAFCQNCGSPVYSRRTAMPQVLRIRAGLLDEPLHTSLAFHQHVASRAQWWPTPDDALPHYDAAKPA